ncbi:hypothetical protein Q5752_002722 [Cryptotrichosporon argae]
MSLKLPALLASLPSSGTHALVRPAHWPPNSFYRVTRTKLKFRLAQPGSSALGSGSSSGSAAGSGPALGAGAGSSTVPTEDAAAAVEQAQVRVSGKAWGQLVWNGRLVAPASLLAPPAPRLRGALKHAWAPVDPAALDARTRAALEEAAPALAELERKREDEFARRKREGRRAARA